MKTFKVILLTLAAATSFSVGVAQAQTPTQIQPAPSADENIPRAHAISGLDDGTESHPIKVTSPVNQSDGPLDEGTETRMSPEMLATIAPWVSNTRVSLEDLIVEVKTLPLSMAKAKLLDGTEAIVEASVPKRTELFVRYILNRARKTVEEIDKSSSVAVPGVLAQEVRILELSVKLAQKYYQNDVEFLRRIAENTAGNNTAPLNFGAFGVRYSRFLMAMDESVLSTRAQYNIAINALGYLQWDLVKDGNRIIYSPAIGHLYNFLNTMPEHGGHNDVQTIENMRLVRKAYQRVLEILAETNAPLDSQVDDTK